VGGIIPAICLKHNRESAVALPGIGRMSDDWTIVSVCAKICKFVDILNAYATFEV